MEGPFIGETPKDVRNKCPDCRSNAAAKMSIEDFPVDNRDMVLEAMESGADFYKCGACQKRWAVVKAPAGYDPLEDGPGSVVKDLMVPHTKGPRGAPNNRRIRRASEALARRAVDRNIRMAKASGDYQDDLTSRPAPLSEEERKRARNARKKATQEKRR